MPNKISKFSIILPEQILISTTDGQDRKLTLQFHLRRIIYLAGSYLIKENYFSQIFNFFFLQRDVYISKILNFYRRL